ncbi:MAG: RagB/SusD family nutrient uptake outer membrane protein [Cytophagales bacterium]|nr:RagB/SusD family nutrient uptake outer membrane protein [Cytophagales bacterium]
MKINNKGYIAATLMLLLISTSCSDFLEEEPISIQTADAYYATEAGFEDLIKSNYTLLRDIHQARNLVLQGTDMFTYIGWNEAANGDQGHPLNAYDIRLNSSLGDLEALWDLLYRQIGRSNTAITRQVDVVDMDEDIKAIRVAEAKFLRAFAYFYAVQQWGDIPMPLQEVTTATREVTKIPAAEVYNQIIKDLEEAVAVLPTQGSTDYGRATKGAAQFLLARVYLTRGWNFNNSLGGTAADFDRAVQYADQVISAYPLEPEYRNLFPLHSENPLEETFPEQNDKNPEIVFAVQFSEDVNSYGGDPSNNSAQPGNDYHSVFGGNAEDIPGELGRTSDYNRHLTKFITTPAMYRLFDPDIDTRYHLNFVDAQYALSDVNDFVPNEADPDTKINIAKGDTVLLFRPWNDPAGPTEKGMDVGGSKRYAVINNDEIGIIDLSPYHGRYKTPLMWKFWQPGIPYADAEGTFDFALFRSAEAYLIAAEAILKGASSGSLGGAEVYYNTIVDRALGVDAGSDPLKAREPANLGSLEAESYRANGNLDIDMILDERARELLGEYSRWYDLKRTGKLEERTELMNPWTSQVGDIKEYHYLRPIPQHEIDRSIPSISQNDGY